ncbi:hypothetical protein AB0M92_26165 [Streptomyces sp. NPDC051582]|uniref:hypothetical protein n=1 Tax=Streptomyces sp. NPDC051582 TaxID=3155167 RepID=UPI003421D3F0
MSILNLKVRQRGALPAAPPVAAALPLAMSLLAMTVVFGDRLGTFATVAVIAVSLVLIACTAGLAARTAALETERMRRDEEVLGALEPPAGLRR